MTSLNFSSARPGVPASARVFLVDDHPLVRESLSALIGRQPGMLVVGEAADSATAFNALLRNSADVVLVDLSLPGESGIELIKHLQALRPTPRVLVVSMHEESFYAERALRAGALGYVMKHETTDKVIEAIRTVLAGRPYISGPIAADLALKVAGSRGGPEQPAVAQLSDRERDVFRLLGKGIETRRIAEDLHLSPKTVQVYCGRIKEKLGLANATELIREAVLWNDRLRPD